MIALTVFSLTLAALFAFNMVGAYVKLERVSKAMRESQDAREASDRELKELRHDVYVQQRELGELRKLAALPSYKR